MIVCMCRVLSDRAIRAAIAGGAATVEQVAAACRAGTCCGACVPDLERMIEEAGVAVCGDAFALPRDCGGNS